MRPTPATRVIERLSDNREFVRAVQEGIVARGGYIGPFGPKKDGVDGYMEGMSWSGFEKLSPEDQRAVVRGAFEKLNEARNAQPDAKVTIAPDNTKIPTARADSSSAPRGRLREEQSTVTQDGNPQITRNINSFAFASRDEHGVLVAGNNVDKVGPVASVAKVMMLRSALMQIQAQGGDTAVSRFITDHQSDINDMMNYAHPGHYNPAAREVASAAATQLGISDKEFLARVNSDLESFQTVDGVKHRSGSGPTTVLKNFTGEGTTTPREMTAIMSDAAKRFRNVFMNDYGNKFRPEVFNGQFAFNKPGHLETGEAGAKTPMNNVVGVLTNGATIAVSSEKPSTMDADIRRGIKLAISAAKGEHITQGDSVAMRSEDSAGPASHGNGQSIALDGSSLSVFDAGRAQLALPKTTSPNTDCAKTVRRIFDAGNVHIRGKNGETLSTAAAYAPALQCDPRFTKIGGGNGASFTVERARQMAQATLGKCDIPIVVVMINERSQQPLAKDGHIFYVNADDKPYSGFRHRDGKTGMSDPGNFKYVAFAYTGPVKDYTPNMQLADVTETQTKALAHQHLNQRHHHVRPPQAPA